MTPLQLLDAVQRGQVPGRHLIVSAHPDDETISCAALLSAVSDATILQVTTGVHADQPADVVERRLSERTAALAAAGWPWPVIDLGYPGRTAHLHGAEALARVADLLTAVDAVWTHPYEGGHLDHDTAAWLVQRACERMARPPARMEFASYHLTTIGRQVFGEFSGDQGVIATMTGDALDRKRAAAAAYVSQAHILRKFKTWHLEYYRVAPVYDFHAPAPRVASRWDVRGYTPSTTDWRRCIAACELEAA